ncbi:MAG: transketolase [Gammaproteobacteria bacterium]|nr:transketolase [Gammaproteobacteria bacterium]
MDTKVQQEQAKSEIRREMANAIRVLSMDAVQKANSGHPGLPMGMADVASVLFADFLKFDSVDPDWPDRDRFILSAGHGSMLLYSLLYLCGYEDMTIEQIRNFRQLGARTAGHPEYGYAQGIEMTTGPLGQGIATAVGMALAEKKLAFEFGDDIVDHYTYVLAGDGCLMEGISHEAIDFAGHLQLSKLIVLFDDNGISIDGATSLTTSTNQLARFEAANWDVSYVDGHDPVAIADAIAKARKSDKPSLIACKTVIGFGAPNKQGSAATHGAPLGEEEIALTRAALDWSSAPFEVPEDLLSSWRACGQRSLDARQQWQARLDAMPADQRARFEAMQSGSLGQEFQSCIETLKRRFSEEQPKLATRQSSQQVLESLMDTVPWLLSGSADLSGSNGTKPGNAVSLTRDNFSGNYVHYGVREHGMAAAMNGIALHGGYIPFSGTFLAFADYSRPAIRLGALMKQRVVHVMTHDSIGLGEDGPTHQPVEQIASLRAMPNLMVFRPADAVEVAESWACALAATNSPSVLCLTRQGVPTLRGKHRRENLCARGAYLLREPRGKRKATLLATGSEVQIALEAADMLARFGVEVAVASMPCWELFEQQSPEYQQIVLGGECRVAIEAASPMGWDRWLGRRSSIIGMSGFGASATAEDLYQHFGITAQAVHDEVRRLLQI